MPWAPDHHEVHVLLARLDGPAGAAPYAIWRLLDDEERARARSLVTGPQAEGFVAAHAVLRVALANALGIEPRAVRLRSAGEDAPSSAAPVAAALRFSLAHSATFAAVALARAREVGIDVQEVRPVPTALELAARHLPPDDVAVLQRTAPDRRAREFLQRWARREAALRARGLSLSALLGSAAEARPRLGAAARGWFRTDLALGDGHVGALAVEAGPALQIATWRARPVEARDALYPFAFVPADASASAT